MQRISEVMTRDVRFLSPRESLQRAAQMMDELNVGAIPVCDNERLVGMITDRDITVRATAAGKPPQAHIEEAMSGDVRWCFEDQSIDDVMQQMADTQIRRVPVVSHDAQHRLVGIVALGDLATKTDAGRDQVEGVVAKVSSPSEPDRSTTGRSGGQGSLDGAQLASRSASENAVAGAPQAGGTAAVVGQNGGTEAAAGARDSGTAVSVEHRRDNAGPAGVDAAGTSGTSGGTAGGTAGRGSKARGNGKV